VKIPENAPVKQKREKRGQVVGPILHEAYTSRSTPKLFHQKIIVAFRSCSEPVWYRITAIVLWSGPWFSKSIDVSAPGAAPLDPAKAEIARPKVVAQSKSTGMTLCSQSRENRSKVTIRADIHSESTGFAIRPGPEVARPETEIAAVMGPFGDVAAVSSRNQSVESGSEAGDVEPQSGYPLPT